MGELLGGLISLVLSFLMPLLIISNFNTGDQTSSFHQALREGGRAGANYPAPSFDPNTNGTSMAADNLMIDESYLTFKTAFVAGVPQGKIDSFDFYPVSPENPEDCKVTATVEIPRLFYNMLGLIGGSSFSKTTKQTFSAVYYREWDYDQSVTSGVITPSTNGPAQSN